MKIGFANLNNIKRNIYITNETITIQTETVENAVYAFYLNHRLGTEKIFYSPNNSCSFNIKADTGEYSARFFYKVNDEVMAISVYFIIESSGSLYFCDIEAIANEKGFSVEYYNMDSPITFVVFNGDGSRKSTPPFGLGFLIKRGYNVVAVKQENNRYQALSFNDFKYYVKPLVNGKSVYLYGSSLGGYCSLYYAGAVDGHVIAAAPRNPIHPCLTSMTKEVGEYHHDLFSVKEKTKNFILVIVDTNNKIDKTFLEDYVKIVYPHAKILEIKGAGHEVLLHLNYTGELKNIIDNFVQGSYERISLNPAATSPYKDKESAALLYSKESYREALAHASKALLNSNRTSLDNQVLSIIHSIVKKIRESL